MSIDASPAPAGDRTLTAMFGEELRLLRELDDRPSVAADPVLKRMLTQAVRVSLDPICSQAQADGVPCQDVKRSCDRCLEALESIRRIRVSFQREIELREETLRRRLQGGEDLP